MGKQKIRKQVKHTKRYFSGEHTQKASKYKKRSSTPENYAEWEKKPNPNKRLLLLYVSTYVTSLK